MKSIRLMAFVFVAFCTSSHADCQDLPDRLVDLIRGETHIGLKYIEKTNDYIVTLLTKTEASIEQDVAKLGVAELFAKHPQVKEAGDSTLAAFKQELAAKESDLPDGTRFGRAKLFVSPTAGTLHNVIHVGQDCILLETAIDDEPKKFAVNSRLIREIGWYGGPGFSTSVRHLRESETEQ